VSLLRGLRFTILLLLLGATWTLSPFGASAHARPMGSRMRYLALGDSYTIGEAVPDASRWPRQLAAALREKGIALQDPLIIARTGWTTDELDAAIDAAHPHGPYAFVTLLIGVNNQYRGRDRAEYRTQFRHLLGRAIRFAGDHAAHVLVVSIPDWGVTAFAEGRDRTGIAHEIDAFNAIALEETAQAGARFADITPVSRALGASPDALAADGLHPSAQAYTAWLSVITPAAMAILAHP
jgi:lysophospholipase L1-like esterase